MGKREKPGYNEVSKMAKGFADADISRTDSFAKMHELNEYRDIIKKRENTFSEEQPYIDQSFGLSKEEIQHSNELIAEENKRWKAMQRELEPLKQKIEELESLEAQIFSIEEQANKYQAVAALRDYAGAFETGDESAIKQAEQNIKDYFVKYGELIEKYWLDRRVNDRNQTGEIGLERVFYGHAPGLGSDLNRFKNGFAAERAISFLNAWSKDKILYGDFNLRQYVDYTERDVDGSGKKIEVAEGMAKAQNNLDVMANIMKAIGGDYICKEFSVKKNGQPFCSAGDYGMKMNVDLYRAYGIKMIPDIEEYLYLPEYRA